MTSNHKLLFHNRLHERLLAPDPDAVLRTFSNREGVGTHSKSSGKVPSRSTNEIASGKMPTGNSRQDGSGFSLESASICLPASKQVIGAVTVLHVSPTVRVSLTVRTVPTPPPADLSGKRKVVTVMPSSDVRLGKSGIAHVLSRLDHPRLANAVGMPETPTHGS
jgi:hypothetical protein